MHIPFHTAHCREGYGCHSTCPVMNLLVDRDQWRKSAEDLADCLMNEYTLRLSPVSEHTVKVYQEFQQQRKRK
jgi:hypothetical protein